MAFLDETGLAELWSLVKSEDNVVKAFADTKVTTEAGSYTGTGKYGTSNKNTLTFGFTPKVIFIAQSTFGSMIVSHNGWTSYSRIGDSGNSGTQVASWGDKSFSWYSTGGESLQFNTNGVKYYYIALG